MRATRRKGQTARISLPMALRYNRFRDRLPRKQQAVMPVTVFDTIKDGATIFGFPYEARTVTMPL